MKVILQKDVKNVGKVGDVVNVSTGYARNYLFPRKMAEIAAERKVLRRGSIFNKMQHKNEEGTR